MNIIFLLDNILPIAIPTKKSKIASLSETKTIALENQTLIIIRVPIMISL